MGKPFILAPPLETTFTFGVGVCDMLEVELQLRGSGLRPRSPARAL